MIFPSHYRFYTHSLITGHSYIFFLILSNLPTFRYPLIFHPYPYLLKSFYYTIYYTISVKNHTIWRPRQKARTRRNLVRLYGLWRCRTKSAASPPYQLHLPQFVHGIQLFFLIFASQGRISTEDASELRIVHCWFRTWKQISSPSILICTGSIWIFSGCMQLW